MCARWCPVGGDKHRYTLITFQCIENWLDPDKVPEGSMPTPILVVYSATHARLEDIAPDGSWKRQVIKGTKASGDALERL